MADCSLCFPQEGVTHHEHLAFLFGVEASCLHSLGDGASADGSAGAMRSAHLSRGSRGKVILGLHVLGPETTIHQLAPGWASQLLFLLFIFMSSAILVLSSLFFQRRAWQRSSISCSWVLIVHILLMSAWSSLIWHSTYSTREHAP